MEDSTPLMWSCKKEHYKKIKKDLGKKISQKKLKYDCNLNHYGDNFHIILKMK